MAFSTALFAQSPFPPFMSGGAPPRLVFRSDGTLEQATPSSADPQSEQQTSATKPNRDHPASLTPDNNKKLTVNPVTGMVTTTPQDYSPLTGEQRWRVYWKGTYFSYGAYFKPVFFALILDQASGSPRQWGGGFAGFGRRVASRTGSNIVQGTIRAPIAYALHEDVRFIYSGQHGFGRRTLHAIVYSFLTFNDQGAPTPNISKFVGYYSSTAISTMWRPPSKKSLLRYTFVNGTEQLGLSVPINIFQEFWPDMARKFQHRNAR